MVQSRDLNDPQAVRLHLRNIAQAMGRADLGQAVENATISVPSPESSPVQPAGDEVLDFCDERCKAFLQQWIKQGLPKPVVGFELQDDSGRVTAESELAWPDGKVAALLPEGMDAKQAFEDAKWTVFDATQLAANETQLRQLIQG